MPDKAPAKASFGEKALDDDLVSTVVPEDSEAGRGQSAS